MQFRTFSTTAPVLAQDPNENSIRSVDIEKIQKHRYTAFIKHVFWPSEDQIVSKTISKKQILGDMQTFKNILTTVLKSEYLPSGQVIDSNSVAAENIRDSNDYILLKYNYDGGEIQIQDGKALYISILPENDAKVELPNLANYVKSVALKVIKLPKSDKTEEPEVFISMLDIGQSKCGCMLYLESFPPQYWYSYLRWWSDGKNILFEIGKASFDGEDISKRAGPPENLKAPRKFKKESKPPQ